jgi:hypothetical protein
MSSSTIIRTPFLKLFHEKTQRQIDEQFNRHILGNILREIAKKNLYFGADVALFLITVNTYLMRKFATWKYNPVTYSLYLLPHTEKILCVEHRIDIN